MLKIDKAVYEGYLWYSDKKAPQIIDGEFGIELSDSQNPFVVEGMLYCADRRQSITIKFIDGTYVVSKHTVSEEDFNSTDVEVCEYVPHRMGGVEKLLLLQYWTPEKDDLCCGMETLVPAKKVFIGFKK